MAVSFVVQELAESCIPSKVTVPQEVVVAAAVDGAAVVIMPGTCSQARNMGTTQLTCQKSLVKHGLFRAIPAQQQQQCWSPALDRQPELSDARPRLKY